MTSQWWRFITSRLKIIKYYQILSFYFKYYQILSNIIILFLIYFKYKFHIYHNFAQILLKFNQFFTNMLKNSQKFYFFLWRNFLENFFWKALIIGNFFRRQFTEVVLQRYLNDPTIRETTHRLLAEFFLGIWFQKPKPIKLKIGDESYDLVGIRPCRNQPLTFGERKNLRKLNELPYQLQRSKMTEELLKNCLTNFEWLEMKRTGAGMAAILADYDNYLKENENHVGIQVFDSNSFQI